MNEFLEQFLIESRELVEQATSDLLALEDKPADGERLDGVFRAFHTLKGAAGIVDFTAMGRALHAAEDVLSRVRNGQARVTPMLISDCLTCLDQVVQWLDAMQGSGETPSDAEAKADVIVARFAGPELMATPAAPPPSTNWAYDLGAKHPADRARARTALRYRPDEEGFFWGDDPVAAMEALPELLRLELEPIEPWPSLDAFEPFVCRLVIMALSSASSEVLSPFCATLGGQVELTALAEPTVQDEGLPPEARDLLDAQLLLLDEPAPEGAAGRMAAAGRVAANVLQHLGRTVEARQVEQASAMPEALRRAIETVLAGFPIVEPDALESAAAAAAAPVADAPPRVLRVDVERVDALVKLTGELMVAKNALGHIARLAQDGADAKGLALVLKDQHALFERLVNELQRSVLGIRVLPLRQVFQRFPRLVREMAASVGKPIRLVTEGDAVEADKAIVESLFEPLLHMLRNAVDHGVEPEQARLAAGKPSMATIHLRGARNGEYVHIEVEDDGGGIDVARIRRVAAERGVASAEVLAAMPDEEAAELIFAPGFSTAAEVTGLSGRGVGMDAVRAVVGRLGGRVTLENRPGIGAKVRLTLPFTVMMTRLMTVEAGGQAFGIPMDAVVETVKVARERIAPVGAARAFVLRNRTIPLIDLAEALGETRETSPGADANVVVVAVGGQLGSLEVDRLGERIDVMLKPMDGLLSGMPDVAGTTLLGDGRVLIVLDLQALLL